MNTTNTELLTGATEETTVVTTEDTAQSNDAASTTEVTEVKVEKALPKGFLKVTGGTAGHSFSVNVHTYIFDEDGETVVSKEDAPGVPSEYTVIKK